MIAFVLLLEIDTSFKIKVVPADKEIVEAVPEEKKHPIMEEFGEFDPCVSAVVFIAEHWIDESSTVITHPLLVVTGDTNIEYLINKGPEDVLAVVELPVLFKEHLNIDNGLGDV